MRSFSDTLNELIVLTEEAITRPQALFDPRFKDRFWRVDAEVRRADAQPAEDVRTSNAAMIVVIAMTAAIAAPAPAPWRMIIGASLDLLRADAYQQLLNDRGARG